MTQRRLDALLEDLGRARSGPALERSIWALRDLYDVEHVVYHSVRGDGRQWGALTYSEEWVAEYTAQHMQRVDPVVQGCFRGLRPVDWKELDWSPRPARALLGEAVGAGLGNQGVSLPIRGPAGQFALFTVNDRASDAGWARFVATHRDEIILAAHYVNECARGLEGTGEAPAPARPLSPREVDALSMLAAGKSRAQAADALAISEHTLRAYLEGARLKLGASNTVHAVAAALSRGLIAL
jgi:DNA-binding CsgD family transcriptional regulator